MPLYQNPTNLVAGGLTGLGDNGVGEIQLTNATTVPTTNPTGGVTIYAQMGTVYARDPNGTVLNMVSAAAPSAPVTGALGETARRFNISAAFTPASGTLYVGSVFITAGRTVGHVGFVSDTTAAVSPTHWWTVLLDNTFTQQAHSADQTTTALTASTWQPLAMVTPYTTTYSGTYFLGIMIATSGSQPTICASANAPRPALVTGTGLVTPASNGASTTGLTGPGTDGTTVYSAPTAAAQMPYMYAAA